MHSKYLLLGVSDDSYTKDGVQKPWFSHYFRGADGKVICRQGKVKMCDDVSDEVLAQLPKVEVTLKEINVTKDGKASSFIVMESVKLI